MQLTNTREALRLAKDYSHLNEEALSLIEASIDSAEATARNMIGKDNARFRIGLLWTDIFLIILDTPHDEQRTLLYNVFKYSVRADQASI
jgi:hypothetical protein